MITKWLHVGEIGSDPWILPIMGAINKAVTNKKCNEIDNNLREMGAYVTTRLNIIPIIIERINLEWDNLYKKIKNYTQINIFKKNKDAHAILVDKTLIYKILADIDSFLFETNSCCELMVKLLNMIYIHRGIKFQKKMGLILKKLFIDHGQDPEWFKFLDKERNFFIHNGSPYLAVDISKDDPDLIIMKELSFDNNQKYIRLSELNNIVYGFSKAKCILQGHIISIYSS